MRKHWRFILATIALAVGIFASIPPESSSTKFPRVAATISKLGLAPAAHTSDGKGQTLRETIARLTSDIECRIDHKALAADGISLDFPIPVDPRNKTVFEALKFAFRQAGHQRGLAYEIDDDGALFITTLRGFRARCVERSYDVADLLPYRGTGGVWSPRDLPSLIESVVAPDTWMSDGGKYGMLRLDGATLVVVQTPANHRSVADVLEDLRDTRGIDLPRWVLSEPGDR